MKKAVSTIIAVILMLIITIALAGTAYIYVSGILTSRMSKTIEVMDITCLKNNATHSNITIIVSNKGTDRIGDGELDIYINNNPVDPATSGLDLDPIDPRDVAVDTYTFAPYVNKTSILVVSPSNSVPQTIWC